MIALAVRVRQIVRHWTLLGAAQPAQAKLTDEVDRIAAGLGLRPVPIVVMDGIGSPFVWCFGRVRLVWPERFTSDAEFGRYGSVIAHELAHVLRRDHWVAWLELVVGVLWWWFPLYWFVRRQVRETAEMACDAIALDALPDGRRAYAELFLELSSSIETGAPATFLGVRADARNSFERRFSMILSDRVSSKTSLCGLVFAGLLACVAAPGWSLGQAEPPSEANSADSSEVAGDGQTETLTASSGDDEGQISGSAAAPTRDSEPPSDAVTTPSGTSKDDVDARLRRLEELMTKVVAKLDPYEFVDPRAVRQRTSSEPADRFNAVEIGDRRIAITVKENGIGLRAIDPSNRIDWTLSVGSWSMLRQDDIPVVSRSASRRGESACYGIGGERDTQTRGVRAFWKNPLSRVSSLCLRRRRQPKFEGRIAGATAIDDGRFGCRETIIAESIHRQAAVGEPVGRKGIQFAGLDVDRRGPFGQGV